jgi:hypothetical protein|tara:strand:- start:1011 stop:1445 length:435 start_codon:yes stop_codon:yes gene_type:complete
MDLNELLEEWSKDSDIDRTELGREAIKIPKLHAKYFKIFASERLAMRRLEEKYKELRQLKYEYYDGTLDKSTLDKYGWDPQPLKILRADIANYISADADIIDLNLKIAYAKEKVDFLESAIRSLQTRGYNIKSAIDWEKFKVGL